MDDVRGFLLGYFYPRPPRGGRLSIMGSGQGAKKFLSTPSARRATDNINGTVDARSISIHALREEGDRRLFWLLLRQRNFYPRPPRGGRHHQFTHPSPYTLFLSTPSARRATIIR